MCGIYEDVPELKAIDKVIIKSNTSWHREKLTILTSNNAEMTALYQPYL